jgi:hypothetical protein
MKIEVKQEHIERGKPGGCYCPIALAVKETLNPYDVSVGYHSMSVFTTVIDMKTVKLPRPAFDFAFDFDAGRNVAPFSFEIEGLEANQ